MSDDDRYDDENEETGTWAESCSASDLAQLVVALPGSEIVEVPAVLPVLPASAIVPPVPLLLEHARGRAMSPTTPIARTIFIIDLLNSMLEKAAPYNHCPRVSRDNREQALSPAA